MGPKTRSVRPKTRRAFDVETYLESTGPARAIVEYRRGDVVFSQGDAAADIRYIQKGAIRSFSLRMRGGASHSSFISAGVVAGQAAAGV